MIDFAKKVNRGGCRAGSRAESTSMNFKRALITTKVFVLRKLACQGVINMFMFRLISYRFFALVFLRLHDEK